MIQHVLAVIPARGGSKGIPGKNILPLGGKPLIAHAIEMCGAAVHVTRTVVSTDDALIAAAAKEHGAEVVHRPAQLSGDRASSEAAVLHVLNALEESEGYVPDVVALVQCTSPFTRSADLDGAVEELISTASDCAFAAAPSHQFLWRRDAPGTATGINHDPSHRLMRQEREPEFVETGAFYLMRAAGLRDAGHRFFGKILLHEVAPDTVLELDEPADVVVAQARYAALGRGVARAALPSRIAAVVMDFDGVLTDDRVLTDQDGVEAVYSSRADGMGIERLRRAGMPMMVISKERNAAVAARCRKLSIPVEQSVDDKRPVLEAWLTRHNLDPAETVYVGNDVNDLACLRFVGCGAVPRDAHPAARAGASLVLDADGGRGAIRLLSDLILAEQAWEN